MKTFVELRQQLDEINFKQDHKKNHISSTKIKKTEVAYHSERKGSKKIRVFVKPKSSREFEELGVFKDMKTAQKSAEQFVKLMGEDLDEGISFWKEAIEKVDGPVNLDEAAEIYHRRDGKDIDPQTMKAMDRMARDYRLKFKKISKKEVEVKGGMKKLNDFGMIFVGRSRYGDLTTV